MLLDILLPINLAAILFFLAIIAANLREIADLLRWLKDNADKAPVATTEADDNDPGAYA